MTDRNDLHEQIHKTIQDAKHKAAIAQGIIPPPTPAPMGTRTAATAAPAPMGTRTAATAAPAAAPAAAPSAAPSTAEGTAQAIKQQLALIPFTIVKSLSLLENIYETRLFGWLIAKAQSVLKLYNKDLSEINIEHALGMTKVTIPARYILQDGDKNYSQVTKSFSLATKKIEYEKNNVIYHLNIIAFPTLTKEGRRSMLSFVVHNDMWHALLDFSKGYRLFNFDTFMRLQSKYSVIMYLLITQQSEPKTYNVETLKLLLGCESKAYERGANLFARVIEPAHAELKEKAPWFFEYSAWKEGKRHKITTVTITPVLNKKYILPECSEIQDKADELRLNIDKEVCTYIKANFEMTHKEIERIEQYIFKLGDKNKALNLICKIKENCATGRVKNKKGYLVRALQQATK